jgi:Lon protease-like protein
MFPLGTVLFPGMGLPLHVFEARYRTMTEEILAGDRRFGVVLIERGSEVGGGDQRFDVGTVAEVAEAAQTADGRWALIAVGRERFRVEDWLPEDPYPAALVSPCTEQPAGDGCSEALAEADKNVRRSLALAAELGEPSPLPPGFGLPDDPVAAGWQLASIAPIGPVDRQRLLADDDPVSRLVTLAQLADDAATMLAYRLSRG